MLPCPNCGELAEDDAKFCHMCGERMTTTIARVPNSYEPPPEEPAGRRWKLIAVVAALLILLVVTALLLTAALAGNDSDGTEDPADSSEQPPASAQVLGSTGTINLTVEVFNCAGCHITAMPVDGSAAQTAEVVGNSARFAFASSSTLGLAFEIVHPNGFGGADGPNLVVLAPDQVGQGARVGVHDLIAADRVSVCWSGTVVEQATITLVVDPFSDGTAGGDLRAWADPAIATLPGTAASSRLGTVERPASANCAQAYSDAAGAAR